MLFDIFTHAYEWVEIIICEEVVAYLKGELIYESLLVYLFACSFLKLLL